MIWGKANQFMQQQPALTHTTQRTPTRKPLLQYRWMRYFFTEDAATDTHSISHIQRRAVWIALAFMLQAISTTDFNGIFPFLKSLNSFLPFSTDPRKLVAIWMALRPSTHKTKAKQDEQKQTTDTLTTPHPHRYIWLCYRRLRDDDYGHHTKLLTSTAY